MLNPARHTDGTYNSTQTNQPDGTDTPTITDYYVPYITYFFQVMRILAVQLNHTGYSDPVRLMEDYIIAGATFSVYQMMTVPSTNRTCEL